MGTDNEMEDRSCGPYPRPAMTPNSYEELEAEARERAHYEFAASPPNSQRFTKLADALADLRKQRDEAREQRNYAQQQLDPFAVENHALRAENERLTREFDKGVSRLMCERNEAQAEAERLMRDRDKSDRRSRVYQAANAKLIGERNAAEAEGERLRKVAEGERERIAALFDSFSAEKWMGECVRLMPPPTLTHNLSSKED